MKNVSIIDLLPKDVTIEKSDFSHLFFRYIQQDSNYPDKALHDVIQALSDVMQEEYNKKIDYETERCD
jgi:hypothetical protein